MRGINIDDNADDNANIDWNENLALGAKAFQNYINKLNI